MGARSEARPPSRALSRAGEPQQCSPSPGRGRPREPCGNPFVSLLDGITSRSVVQIAADLGFEVVARDIARGELYQADELFLTGTAAEIVPVREVDDHVLGPPGELTQAIQKRFFDAIKGKRDEYLEWLDFVEFDEGPAKEPAGADERVAS